MNKGDLINTVAEKTGITKKAASSAVEAVLGSISDTLAAGDKVQLIGFGTFETRERSARKAMNPQTGEEIDVPARMLPAFKPGKALRDAVNGN